MTPEPTIDVETFKKFEREGYSSVAQGYDRATAAVTSQVNQAVLDAVAAGPGVSLLDIACGPGWLSAAAAQRGAVVSALDFADNMVALARARCSEADVRNADAESLPFESGRFDAAGVARVRLQDGTAHEAEVRWYEAHGIGRREMKIKFPLLD